MLTVLIPSLESRKPLLNRLVVSLNYQIANFKLQDKVQILTDIDSGQVTIGEKRNRMMQMVMTEHSVFIDDDDQVDTLYLPLIIDHLKNNPDAIGFKGVLKNIKTNKTEIFIHKCGEDYTKRDNIYYRPVNHLNPIRTSISKQIPYPDLRHGEDYNFAIKLRDSGLIKTCSFIDKIMYFYLFNPNKNELQPVRRTR